MAHLRNLDLKKWIVALHFMITRHYSCVLEALFPFSQAWGSYLSLVLSHVCCMPPIEPCVLLKCVDRCELACFTGQMQCILCSFSLSPTLIGVWYTYHFLIILNKYFYSIYFNSQMLCDISLYPRIACLTVLLKSITLTKLSEVKIIVDARFFERKHC